MNIDMIRAAAVRIEGNVIKTPLLWSAALDEIAGRKVFVKAEAVQVTGSFKARGGWAAVSALPQEALDKGVIAYSSGNHAQGVARAAKAHGAPAVIVMHSDAPQAKIESASTSGTMIQIISTLRVSIMRRGRS